MKTLLEILNYRIPISPVPEEVSREVKQFFKENPLALQVASSRESYTFLVSEAVRRYSTEKSRERIPLADKKFDDQVSNAIDSMNQVGLPPRINSQDFTTKRVNDNLDTMHSLPQSLGVLTGIVSYLGLSILDEQFAALGSVAAYTKVSLGIKRRSERGFEQRVKQLSFAASRCDRFLRVTYPRISN